MTHWAWVCKLCSNMTTPAGQKTLRSVTDAGRLHGCFRVTKPQSKRLARTLVRVQVPSLLSTEKWRSVWDSLDRPFNHAPSCRSERGSCGHPEGSHFFWTVTQGDCVVNCSRCAS